MDNITEYKIIKSKNVKSEGLYTLSFKLSEQQCYASEKILSAIENCENLLLYAVTGAGKTEMIYEGISLSRKRGFNVAVISPRVDVVIEISQRIKEVFLKENIDVLHQSSKQQYNGHFVICTIHQLYRFKNHFEVIFVDEVDAFPLPMDHHLQNAIKQAAKPLSTLIYMTATPPRHLLHQIPKHRIIQLPARFHRHPLPVPKFKYFKLNMNRTQSFLKYMLLNQIEHKRFTLVFFNNIENMIKISEYYKKIFSDLICISSEDALRFEKVKALREGKHRIVFTTTILERGFTMAQLDVIVINADTFEKAALVQIAGRVGRKQEAPTGMVLFLHEGVSISMLMAKKDITKMNKLGIQRGWIDE